MARGCPQSYELTTLWRVARLFESDNMICVNRYDDMALLEPMMMITHQIDNFQRGDLVIPIKSNGQNKILALCPLKAIDQDDRTVALDSIIKFHPDVLKTTYEKGNPVSTIKGENDITILPGSEIAERNYLEVRRKLYRVNSVGDEDPLFRMYGRKHKVYIDVKFEHTVKNNRLHFKNMPLIHGYVHEFEKFILQHHNPVTISFEKKKLQGNNHGTVTVTFHNLIFNASGFFTQDRAVVTAQSGG